MPSLGADMESGKLLEWRVAPGDRVRRGDIVATVDTSKAEIDIEVFEDGIVEQLIVKPGERVPVGAVLATIRTEAPAAAAPVRAPEAPPLAPPEPEAPAPPVVVAAMPPATDDGRVVASPYARRLAGERSVALDG